MPGTEQTFNNMIILILFIFSPVFGEHPFLVGSGLGLLLASGPCRSNIQGNEASETPWLHFTSRRNPHHDLAAWKHRLDFPQSFSLGTLTSLSYSHKKCCMPLEIIVALWFAFHRSTLGWANVKSSFATVHVSTQWFPSLAPGCLKLVSKFPTNSGIFSCNFCYFALSVHLLIHLNVCLSNWISI